MMKVGENLYTSNNTEVALQQSSPFEIGIQEIFDSEYGYAGLQNKKHSLIYFMISLQKQSMLIVEIQFQQQ